MKSPNKRGIVCEDCHFLGVPQIYGQHSGWVASSILALRSMNLPRVEMNARITQILVSNKAVVLVIFLFSCMNFPFAIFFETCLFNLLPDHTLLLISPCQSFPWSHSALTFFLLSLLCFTLFPLLFLCSFYLSTHHTHMYTHTCVHTHTHTHTVDAWLKIVLALPRINPPIRPFKVCNDRVCFYDLSQSKCKSERFRLGF